MDIIHINKEESDDVGIIHKKKGPTLLYKKHDEGNIMRDNQTKHNVLVLNRTLIFSLNIHD